MPNAEKDGRRFVVEHDYLRQESRVVDRQALEAAMFPLGQPRLREVADIYEREPERFQLLSRRPLLRVLDGVG